LYYSYHKGLVVAFKLKRITVDNAVQGSKQGKPKYSAEKVGASKSMDNSSVERSEGRIPESSGMEEDKFSDDMVEQKEGSTGEATKSDDKCTADALEESEKTGKGVSLSMDGKSLSGNMNNPISRVNLVIPSFFFLKVCGLQYWG
jgi:hypothetical protein